MRKRVELYFVTGNVHKFMEISEIIKQYAPWVQLSIAKKGFKLEIQSESLEEIALYAAKNIAQKIEDMFIVEESGLFIDALNGFPGPYSSYVYKTIGCRGILKLMRDIKDRSAEFRSVIILYHYGKFHSFVGIAKGKISTKMSGEHGFGFYPIFIPEGSDKTFAEMETNEKNLFSHRGASTRKLVEFLKQHFERT